MTTEVLPMPAQPHLAARRLYFLLSLSQTPFTTYYRYRNGAFLTAYAAMALLLIPLFSFLHNPLGSALAGAAFLVLAALFIVGALAAIVLSLVLALLPSRHSTLVVDRNGLSLHLPDQCYVLADIECITVLTRTPTLANSSPVYPWGARLKLTNTPEPYYLSSASADEMSRIIALAGDKVAYQESHWLATRFDVFFGKLVDNTWLFWQ